MDFHTFTQLFLLIIANLSLIRSLGPGQSAQLLGNVGIHLNGLRYDIYVGIKRAEDIGPAMPAGYTTQQPTPLTAALTNVDHVAQLAQAQGMQPQQFVNQAVGIGAAPAPIAATVYPPNVPIPSVQPSAFGQPGVVQGQSMFQAPASAPVPLSF